MSDAENVANKSSIIHGWGINEYSGAAVVGAVAIPLAIPVVLGAAGFSGAGIVAGSIASGIQATMGGVVASGSVFATLTSIGAGGLSTAGTIVAAGVGAGAGAGAVKIVKKWTRGSPGEVPPAAPPVEAKPADVASAPNPDDSASRDSPTKNANL